MATQAERSAAVEKVINSMLASNPHQDRFRLAELAMTAVNIFLPLDEPDTDGSAKSAQSP